MSKNESSVPSTPTVQVIERMFALMDVLASRKESISLKEISEKNGQH
ncbi:MAG: IclR family transcriptional regulator, partial [Rhodoferax sp.]